MIPQYRTDRNIWRSWLNPFAPNDVTTTGITQPPMLAEAVVQIGAKMPGQSAAAGIVRFIRHYWLITNGYTKNVIRTAKVWYCKFTPGKLASTIRRPGWPNCMNTSCHCGSG